jgi:copper chaperone CopZ
VSSNRIKLLVVATLVAGAASYAYACGDEKKEASNTQAQYTSTEGKASGCGSKAKTTSASVASTAGDNCGAKKAKATSASLASTAGDHCGSMKSAALASGNCTYGDNTVTFAGACPKDNEADYSFVVAGAECMGTGTAVAKAIKAVPGVMAVTVDYEKHMAYVCADGKKASKKAIEKSLKEAGYKEVKFVNAEKANCQKSHGKVQA